MATAPAIARYRLKPVETKAELEQFIRVPWTVFRDDPHWIAPLLFERRQFFSPKHNPYFAHAETRFWLATKDGEPVGRLSAQIDELAQQQPAIGPGTGHFGMFDVIDDPGLTRDLFGHAETWLKDRGMTRALGPFNLSINHEMGLLVDGFDMPPSLMMGHARPYFLTHLEGMGYQKAVDTLAYWFDITDDLSPTVRKLLAWGEANPRIELRDLDKKNYRREIDTLLDIYNDAWSNNWGYIPMTPAEIERLASELKPVVYPYMCRFCLYDDEPIAFMVTLPDVNNLARDLNGRLLPFGWAKLAYRLIKKEFPALRVPLMGVRKGVQRTRHGGVAAFMLIETIRQRAIAHGSVYGELSWILEDNKPMRNMLETIGAIVYKRYRILEKPLS